MAAKNRLAGQSSGGTPNLSLIEIDAQKTVGSRGTNANSAKLCNW